MRTAILSSIAAMVVLAPPAVAQTEDSAQTRNYIDAAGQSDAFEILEAETALTQSSDPQVHDFAQQMIRDHGRLTDALGQATARAGLKSPPMGIGADQAPLLAALQSLRGAEFDRAYWQHQALGHRSALTTTQVYATNGDSSVIRQAAAASIPIIAAHLSMAEQMLARAGGH